MIEGLRCEGISIDKIAARFGVDRLAVWRHCRNHISDERRASFFVGPAKMQELSELAAREGESVVDSLRIARSVIFAKFITLAEGSDHAAFAAVAKRLIEALEKFARVTGQVSTFAANSVNVVNNLTIVNSAPFADLQAGLLQIAARHPEIRTDVVELFRSLDERYAAHEPSQIAAPMKEIAHA